MRLGSSVTMVTGRCLSGACSFTVSAPDYRWTQGNTIDSDAEGLGALLAIPAIKAHSFGGFCACIFIIGNGLGSLETAASPYITGRFTKYRISSVS